MSLNVRLLGNFSENEVYDCHMLTPSEDSAENDVDVVKVVINIPNKPKPSTKKRPRNDRKKDHPDGGIPIDVEVFRIYLERFGNLGIPSSFVIPKSAAWPVEHHEDIFLGKLAERIREGMRSGEENNAFNAGHVQELIALGFSPDNPQNVRIVTAVRKYKQKYGTIHIPDWFVVPDSVDWPTDTHGMKIGKTLSTITNKHTYKAIHTQLMELGCCLAPLKQHNVQQSRKLINAMKEDQLVCALTVYKQIHNNFNIPHNYEIPKYSEHFPRQTWGMDLHTAVENVRDGGDVSDECRQKLVEIGFLLE